MRRRHPFRLLCVTIALALAACGPVSAPVERSPTPSSGTSSAAALARAAGAEFLERYLAPDGRIVRHDQGSDVVSEGQAYGMLVAVAIDDRQAFDSIWSWTRRHLQRPDGLLSWQWDDGQVVDDMPAADADLDAAHALVLAADRFFDPTYDAEARRIADAIAAHEVVDGPIGPVVVAGPWATDGGWVNASYGAPVAHAALADVTGDPVWEAVDDGARQVFDQSATQTDLPADWAMLTSAGVEPRGAPSGGDPRHGYDAARTAIRFAVDCDRAGRTLAAALVDEYDAARRRDGHPPAIMDLAGRAVADHPHPVMTVGHAAAAHAAGGHDRALRFLDLADRLDGTAPTYYGAAWVALGRLWLTTDHLGGCAVGRQSGARLLRGSS